MREPIVLEFENYIYAQGRDRDDAVCATYPLFSEETLTGMLAELREILRQDRERFHPELLQSPVAEGIQNFAGQWFQRIDFPAYGLSTTSNPAWPVPRDQGGVNTLGMRLTSEEACLLRPWPKWFYVRSLLPDLTGKSIMEVGSNNGFFPIRFAELGAARVTGLEVQRKKYESAVWANSVLGWKNLQFLHADFLVDFRVEPHDIIFVSEVINHMLCPFWAVARLVSLAKEMLILDTGVFPSAQHGLELSSGWWRDGDYLRFLNFQISDGLLVSYLRLLGVQPEEIVRYVEPGAEHMLYKIDTRPLHERRAKGDIPDNELRRSLLMEFQFPK